MKKLSKQSKVSLKSILCVSILIIGLSIFSTIRLNATNVSYETPSYSSLIPHGPIEITHDGAFTVFPGSGTAEDPYVIEGYNITTTSNEGIRIIDTTKYFIVRNCYLDAVHYGVLIYNVAEGTATVINNTCSNNDEYGIELYYSDSSTVVNNTCSKNDEYGIDLYYSDSSTVVNNTCSNNGYRGIVLEGSDSSTIANNTCTNNNIGILLWESGSSTVVNNTCSKNDEEGIMLEYSNSSTVVNNTCNNNDVGIMLENSNSSTVVNNTCSYNSYGVYLWDSSSSTVVNNNCSDNNDYGVYLRSSNHSITINNTCCNNGFNGIWLQSSDNSTVISNLCNNNDKINIKLESSGGSTIANNTCCYSNQYGLYGGDGINLITSSYSTVANNTCNNNNKRGIWLQYSDSSTVTNNTCSYNGEGIEFDYSEFCNITYNLFQENEEYGVNLDSDSDNNLIHHNTFVDNYLGGTSQAYDECTNNFWYDTTTLEGNDWSDWSGTGSYSIDGSAGAIDLYPFGESIDIDPPLIVDIVYSPSNPTELDTISINATVTDDSGVQSVTLYYMVNGGDWTEVSMTLVSGDLYSVTIGPFAVSDTIEYYISALDNSVNHNEAFNDNAGLYYSFTVYEIIPEFQTFSLLLPTLTFLFLVFGLVVLQRRKR